LSGDQSIPTGDGSDEVAEPRYPQRGRVGPYEIGEVLGEGGMGIVYRATQIEPIRREVALKLLRHGTHSARVLARFDLERQAIASLSHPNVAQVYEVNATEEGTPFIAMELVLGTKITRYCDDKRSSLVDRLEIFVEVCHGVQHVHQKGLLHRDLKPGNILVMEHAGRPVPKIIDFGIAKAFEGPLADEALTHGEFVGSPQYMAPEVLRGLGQDTRADIYALGVVLIRLLVGVTAVEWGLRDSVLKVIAKLSKDDAIPQPSVRFSSLEASEQAEIARLRDTTARALTTDLRRDLDWIARKAVASNPDNRYGSADELAADIRRYLRGAPVEARPPSVGYVALKAFQRNRLSVLSLGAVVLSLLIGTATTANQARQANEQRLAAERVSEFMVGLLRKSDPYRAAGREVTVREVLDEAAKSLEDEELPPLVRSQLLFTLGESYVQLGQHARARPAVETALHLRRQALGADPAVAEVMVLLAVIDMGEQKLAGVLASLEAAQEIFDQYPGPWEGRERCLQALGRYHLLSGDPKRAQEYYEKALSMSEAELGADSERLVPQLHDMAALAEALGDAGAAEAWLMRGLEITDRNPHEPLTISMLISLSQVYRDDRPEEAVEVAQEALEAALQSVGPRDSLAHNARVSLALATMTLGDFEAGEVLLREVADAGDDATMTTRDLASRNLAIIAFSKGEPEEAERLMRQALAFHTDPTTIEAVAIRNVLARSLTVQGRLDEAETELLAILKIEKERPNPSGMDVSGILVNLAEVHHGRGEHAQAAAMYDRVAKERVATDGEDSPGAVQAIHLAGNALYQAGDIPGAEARYRQSTAKLEVFANPTLRQIILEDMLTLLNAAGRTADAAPYQEQWAALQ